MRSQRVEDADLDAYARRLERLGVDLDAPLPTPRKVPTKQEAFAAIAEWARAELAAGRKLEEESLRHQAFSQLLATDSFDRRDDIESFERALRRSGLNTFRLLKALDRLARPRGRQ